MHQNATKKIRNQSHYERTLPTHYKIVDKEYGRLYCTPPPREQAFLTLKRNNTSTFLEIFLKFIPLEFLRKVQGNLCDFDCVISLRPFWKLIPSISDWYKLLAICIRIQGRHQISQENTLNNSPRREAISEAINHFKSLFNNTTHFGIDVIEKYVSLALITNQYYEDISNNFQECVLFLGESVTGDEKLFRYTGFSPDVRFVPNKPSRVGSWMYELCAELRNWMKYITLFTNLHQNSERKSCFNFWKMVDYFSSKGPTPNILSM